MILGLIVVISLLATGAFGQASAQEGGAGGEGTAGGTGSAASQGPSAPAGPVVVGGDWYEFGHDDHPSDAYSCPTCTASSAGNSVFADDPPWTFNLGAGGGVLSVTDAFINGDSFEALDNLVSLGTTPAVAKSGSCGPDPTNPDDCMVDPNSSSNTFALGPGAHSITIRTTDTAFPGAAYFRVDGDTTPPLEDTQDADP